LEQDACSGAWWNQEHDEAGGGVNYYLFILIASFLVVAGAAWCFWPRKDEEGSSNPEDWR
jgi:hypothetical protein